MKKVTPIEAATAMRLSDNVLTEAKHMQKRTRGGEDFKVMFESEVKKLKDADIAKEIGDRITRLCEEKEITAHELSRAAMVTEVSLSRYMHGMRTPNAVALHNMAVALGVSMEYLLTGGEE